MVPERISERMVCPKCRGPLEQVERQLLCHPCSANYPIAAGGTLPVLFPPASDLYDPRYAGYERENELGTAKKGYRQRKRLPQTNVTDMDLSVISRFHELVGDGTILNLGAGERTVRVGDRWVGLDIAPHDNCEVLGDAHRLPFRDSCFDGVHTISVFEHLRKPWIAAQEVVRVLKPGGLLLCSVPFAYPVHGSPHDYFRYTSEGLVSLFEPLQSLELAAGRGPISTIALYSERVADAIFPGKAGFAARWLTAWAIQPFKYADPWLVKKNPDSITSFTLLAVKPRAEM